MHPLDALGNATRRELLTRLRAQPLSVKELAATTDVSRPAISRHLRLLEEAGLVEAEADGQRSIYSVRVQGFAPVRAFLDDFWEVALQRLQTLAEP